MKKINNEECINLIKEKFPKFLPYWEEYVNDWGLDQGITVQMIPFSEYVVDVIKSEDNIEIKEIFDLVEFLLRCGNISVQSGITTSFLEYLLSQDPDEIKFSRFSKYLGKHTIDYCKTWDEFTGVETEGLERNKKHE